MGTYGYIRLDMARYSYYARSYALILVFKNSINRCEPTSPTPDKMILLLLF